jgi:hypothetical protein
MYVIVRLLFFAGSLVAEDGIGVTRGEYPQLSHTLEELSQGLNPSIEKMVARYDLTNFLGMSRMEQQAAAAAAAAAQQQQNATDGVATTAAGATTTTASQTTTSGDVKAIDRQRLQALKTRASNFIQRWKAQDYTGDAPYGSLTLETMTFNDWRPDNSLDKANVTLRYIRALSSLYLHLNSLNAACNHATAEALQAAAQNNAAVAAAAAAAATSGSDGGSSSDGWGSTVATDGSDAEYQAQQQQQQQAYQHLYYPTEQYLIASSDSAQLPYNQLMDLRSGQNIASLHPFFQAKFLEVLINAGCITAAMEVARDMANAINPATGLPQPRILDDSRPLYNLIVAVLLHCNAGAGASTAGGLFSYASAREELPVLVSKLLPRDLLTSLRLYCALPTLQVASTPAGRGASAGAHGPALTPGMRVAVLEIATKAELRAKEAAEADEAAKNPSSTTAGDNAQATPSSIADEESAKKKAPTNTTSIRKWKKGGFKDDADVDEASLYPIHIVYEFALPHHLVVAYAQADREMDKQAYNEAFATQGTTGPDGKLNKQGFNMRTKCLTRLTTQSDYPLYPPRYSPQTAHGFYDIGAAGLPIEPWMATTGGAAKWFEFLKFEVRNQGRNGAFQGWKVHPETAPRHVDVCSPTTLRPFTASRLFDWTISAVQANGRSMVYGNERVRQILSVLATNGANGGSYTPYPPLVLPPLAGEYFKADFTQAATKWLAFLEAMKAAGANPSSMAAAGLLDQQQQYMAAGEGRDNAASSSSSSSAAAAAAAREAQIAEEEENIRLSKRQKKGDTPSPRDSFRRVFPTTGKKRHALEDQSDTTPTNTDTASSSSSGMQALRQQQVQPQVRERIQELNSGGIQEISLDFSSAPVGAPSPRPLPSTERRQKPQQQQVAASSTTTAARKKQDLASSFKPATMLPTLKTATEYRDEVDDVLDASAASAGMQTIKNIVSERGIVVSADDDDDLDEEARYRGDEAQILAEARALMLADDHHDVDASSSVAGEKEGTKGEEDDDDGGMSLKEQTLAAAYRSARSRAIAAADVRPSSRSSDASAAGEKEDDVAAQQAGADGEEDVLGMRLFAIKDEQEGEEPAASAGEDGSTGNGGGGVWEGLASRLSLSWDGDGDGAFATKKKKKTSSSTTKGSKKPRLGSRDDYSLFPPSSPASKAATAIPLTLSASGSPLISNGSVLRGKFGFGVAPPPMSPQQLKSSSGLRAPSFGARAPSLYEGSSEEDEGPEDDHLGKLIDMPPTNTLVAVQGTSAAPKKVPASSAASGASKGPKKAKASPAPLK